MMRADKFKIPTWSIATLLLLLFLSKGSFSQRITTNKILTEADLRGTDETARLRLEGKLKEAYAGYQRRAKEEPDRAWAAEWSMGGIHEQWGELDHALEHYQRALNLVRVKGSEHFTNYTRAELCLLDSIASAHESQGKMGLVAQSRFSIQNIMEERSDEIAAADKANCVDCVEVFGEFALQKANPFRHQDECPEACQIYRKIGGQAENSQRSDRFELMRAAWSQWASHLAFFEHYAEAIELRKKVESLPSDFRYLAGAYLHTIEFANNLAERDGVTGDVWSLVETNLARLENPPHQKAWFKGSLIKACLLDQSGRHDEALKLLDRIVELARAKNYQPQIAAALENKARVELATGELANVEAEAKEALQIYRTLGKKYSEQGLYEIYAGLLGRQGQYKKALQVWEQGYALCENLGLHFRALHMLLGLAELQLRNQRFEELKLTWFRIDDFARLNATEMAEPTWLRLHLARLNYLKNADSLSNLARASARAEAFIKHSNLSSYQMREYESWKTASKVALVPSPSLKPVTLEEPLPLGLDIQPVQVTTRVRTNEIARGHFTLSNPSAELVRGLLGVENDALRFEWKTSNDGLVLKVIPDASGHSVRKEIQLPPAQQILLSVECYPAFQITNHLVTIHYGEGDQRAVLWDFCLRPRRTRAGRDKRQSGGR